MAPLKREKLFSVTADDCEWHYFTVGGHGGSGKDTSNTGVRVVHPPSGATGIGQDERSQLRNRQAAFRRMANTPAFRSWVKMKAASMSGQESIESQVEKAMEPQNLRIEYYNGTRWEERSGGE